MVAGLMGIAVGQLLMTGLAADSSAARLVPGLVVVGVSFGLLNAALVTAGTSLVGGLVVLSCRPRA